MAEAQGGGPCLNTFERLPIPNFWERAWTIAKWAEKPLLFVLSVTSGMLATFSFARGSYRRGGLFLLIFLFGLGADALFATFSASYETRISADKLFGMELWWGRRNLVNLRAYLLLASLGASLTFALKRRFRLSLISFSIAFLLFLLNFYQAYRGIPEVYSTFTSVLFAARFDSSVGLGVSLRRL